MRRRTTCALIATTAAFVLMGARCGGSDEANPGAMGERSGEESLDSDAQMDTAPQGEDSVPDDSTNTQSEDGAAPTTTTP